ncbi:hypothetical protein ACHQM5_021183 [Ranunculus cassubicifolius]
MGNCLISSQKFVQVMKIDGSIVEYQVPVKVHQVLSEFEYHAISDSLPVIQHLSSNTDMHSGRIYYLLPPPLPAKAVKDTRGESKGTRTGIVRIKMVMTKQELKEMLTKGIVSVDQMVSELRNIEDRDRDSNRNCSGWKPVLRSIAE